MTANTKPGSSALAEPPIQDQGIARLDAFHHLSPTERYERGLAAGDRVPHSALGLAGRPPARQDPIAILERQAASRIPELVPVRYGRMVTSPFAFYRGAAAVMASDLAAGESSGLTVQLCGDAHLSNFGVYRSPERQLVFDCNDFDETLPGPFEWDVKRLVTSVEIAGRENGLSTRECRAAVLGAATRYREAMSSLARMGNLAVWYSDLGYLETLNAMSSRLKAGQRAKARQAVARAQHEDSLHAYKKLTTTIGGRRRIISDPPLIVPIEDLVSPEMAAAYLAGLQELVRRYTATLRSDVQHLLTQFRPVDLARKVVGVGSVGTRAWIVLFLGPDDAEPLFLQVKEAQA